ncbi:MAG: MotA/TolQ/ExbB proton channel family protein [Bdellovibrionaceae bacterium]|nr:MotA/TolQ/ExbB proton channel family protein [Pseudobdellovibrionaceae bacterium]
MFTEQFYSISHAGHEVTLWILIVLSIFSVAFIFERLFTLGKVKSKSNKTSIRIQEALQSNNLSEIVDISRDRETLEGRAMAYGLRHAKENGAEGLEEIFNSYALIEKPRFEKYLNFLATVGSNAPFIGLLGTVFGIMDAFRELATSQGDASAVMLGISKALVATGLGLLVAIPAVIAYNYFQRQVKLIMQSLESVKEICLAMAKSKKAIQE